ncbi:MAG: hypothetical protein L0177_10695 [Chloroflexi bacterium]|nr:hypothetical protein [Chloroflexota bacterium]
MAVSITESKLLLVEGPDDLYLFNALVQHLGTTGIQIHPVGGKDNFRPELGAIVRTPGFSDVSSLAIVRDADNSATDAFRSVSDALAAVNLPVPSEPLQLAGTALKVVVLIVPHGGATGALEDVCLASVTADDVMPCLDDYMSCIQSRVADQPGNLSKSKLQAFLASRKQPGLLLGQAAREGYWPWEHPAFEPLKQLLQML